MTKEQEIKRLMKRHGFERAAEEFDPTLNDLDVVLTHWTMRDKRVFGGTVN